MQDYIPGQRWISNTELQMGLGTIIKAEHRTVTVVFLATGETRTYAKQTAPLTRVNFGPGDTVRSIEGGSLKIESIAEADGLITYTGTTDQGETVELPESQLDNQIQLNRPTDRLFGGQVDQNKWYELRYQTRLHLNRLAHSDLRGLTGGRTSLIPHQLYIAHEVANRFAPRVLLADEVGLGKTIEAGLILHHQLLTERAQRILIVVPETLVHQWLVEMLRRFNLHFSIFDEERCEAIEDSAEQDNPFNTAQLVLCSLEFLTNSPARFKQAYLGKWDLLVVDEAHHLQWSPDDPSLEYELVEMLASETKGVLLLTATPEQLGKASHFARLRLLDPDRFPDLDSFIEEEKHYEPFAEAVSELLSQEELGEKAYQTLLETVKEGDNRELLDMLRDNQELDPESKQQARQELVEHLLDRHGTGRVLFRNTRTAVKGFPQRQLTSYSLPPSDEYRDNFSRASANQTQALLSPEILHQLLDPENKTVWTQADPRLPWLGEQLKKIKPEKVLVITAHASTALDIADSLRINNGIHAAVFHEHLSIIERDRAAAYFADEENGTQVLVCSEIGSEGRNFQFAHHLVLFDLPLNPDLLEQRIGRLDRIGQTSTIQIHVPFLENSPQETLLHWYHEGLNAFEHTCPTGQTVFNQVQELLLETLHNKDRTSRQYQDLVNTTAKLNQELVAALHRGRDVLLEYNSCRHDIANEIVDNANKLDKTSTLPDFMELVFDCYGVDLEDDTQTSYIVRPGHHMQTSHFPGLPADGMTITYDRDTALTYEDMVFITWEHPLVTGAIDMVLGNEQGNTAVTAIKHSKINPGLMFLECLYILESASSNRLQTSRYLPPTTIRVVTDQNNKNFSSALSHELIQRHLVHLKSDTSAKIVRMQAKEIRSMLKTCEGLAQEDAPQILQDAHDYAKQTLLTEINRLKALQQVNPNVRSEEIRYFEDQWHAVDQVLDSTNVRLDAIRIIVST